MSPDRRWLLLRAAVWIGIAVYAVLLIRDPGMGDAVGKAALEATGIARPSWMPVRSPAGLSLPPPSSGDAADALVIAQSLSTPGCKVAGRQLRLHLGPAGLSSAEVLGPVPACLAERVWQVAWPAVPGVEIEVVAG